MNESYLGQGCVHLIIRSNENNEPFSRSVYEYCWSAEELSSVDIQIQRSADFVPTFGPTDTGKFDPNP